MGALVRQFAYSPVVNLTGKFVIDFQIASGPLRAREPSSGHRATAVLRLKSVGSGQRGSYQAASGHRAARCSHIAVVTLPRLGVNEEFTKHVLKIIVNSIVKNDMKNMLPPLCQIRKATHGPAKPGSAGHAWPIVLGMSWPSPCCRART